MFLDHDAFRRPLAVADLPDDEALVLWSWRRLVVAWPRCHAVHAALHRRYGDAALGVEHLLRCWLDGVSRHAHRRVAIGEPTCALVLADEMMLLTVVRSATPQATAAASLAALTGNAAAAGLLPLAAALTAAAEL